MLRWTSQKDGQKHLNFKTFRPTISHWRREREQEDEVQNNSLNSDSKRSLVEKSAKRKRVNPTEQKQKLMAKRIDVLDRPKEADDPFALYVTEQLKN